MCGKMADDVHEDIENALNTIASTTERSGNMKKELKHTFYETVSTLGKLFVKLKNISDGKSRTIINLETLVASTNKDLEGVRDKTAKGQATPSVAPRRELARATGWGVAPSGAELTKYQAAGTEQARLYSEALGGKFNQKRYKLTVTSKDSKSPDTIKDILKSNINPTEIRVGISSLKSLRNGKVQIEADNKEDIEILTKDIREKCGDKLEVIMHRLRNPRLVIYKIPEDISTQNIEETILAQNPEFNLDKGDINAKFSYVTKRHTRNLVIEVSAQTRRMLIQKKIKLGWIICSLGDYLVANRCFKCSTFNHRFRECRGIETCPLCAGNHALKDCSASSEDYKCINCHTFNTHNKGPKISDKHSALDRNCPSLQAVLVKYRQNIDY